MGGATTQLFLRAGRSEASIPRAPASCVRRSPVKKPQTTQRDGDGGGRCSRERNSSGRPRDVGAAERPGDGRRRAAGLHERRVRLCGRRRGAAQCARRRRRRGDAAHAGAARRDRRGRLHLARRRPRRPARAAEAQARRVGPAARGREARERAHRLGSVDGRRGGGGGAHAERMPRRATAARNFAPPPTARTERPRASRRRFAPTRSATTPSG